MIKNALKGDFKDIEQLQGFQLSLQCAHRLAGMLSAIQQSQLVPDCFQRVSEEELRKIHCDANRAETSLCGSDVALLSGATAGPPRLSRAAPASTVDVPSPSTQQVESTKPDSEWQCPNCGVHAANTDLGKRAKYGLVRPCSKLHPSCWCEDVVDLEVCSLCVRYFKQRHRQRPSSLERQRHKRKVALCPSRSDTASPREPSQALKRKLTAGPSCDGAALLPPKPSPLQRQRTSSMGSGVNLERAPGSDVSWGCKACTFWHDRPAQRSLQKCALCRTPRTHQGAERVQRAQEL